MGNKNKERWSKAMARVRRHTIGGEPICERKMRSVQGELDIFRSKLRQLIQCDITEDHLINTFVLPEHRDLLTQAAKIANGVNRFSTKVGCEDLKGTIQVQFCVNEPSFIFPTYMGRARTAEGFPVIVELTEGEQKIATFVNEWCALQLEYACGYEAIKELNRRCSNLTQMRFYLKCLPALGIECEYKVPNNLPDIPRELRDQLRRVDEFVARASILPEVEHKGERDKVEMSVQGTVDMPFPWNPNISNTVWM